jgi:hypothetical protein
MSGDVGESMRRPVVSPEASHAYARFLREDARSTGTAYYSDAVVRFELRDEDVLVEPGDLTVGPATCGVQIASQRANARVEVCGLKLGAAEAMLRAIDGARTVAEVRAAAGLHAPGLGPLMEGSFGVLVFAPVAVSTLDARVPAAEIVRYPSSPYEIVRTYWENLAEVRERLDAARAELGDVARFVSLLRELHALALVGSEGSSFYRPASPIAAKSGAEPFSLLSEASIVEESAHGMRFVSGPRVNASLIGGAAYHVLLSECVADPECLEESRSLEWNGLPFGRLLTARADADVTAAPWFCPPRPLEARHFESLRQSFSLAMNAADAGDEHAASTHAAELHWAFVRLHPFPFANQCIAMSLVNHVLRRSHGVGMPHLVLDHLALRLSRDAYERAFRRAVSGWLVRAETPVRRLVELTKRRQRAFQLLDTLQRAETLEDARAAIATRPDDARLLCL